MYTDYMFRTIPDFPNYQASNRDGAIRGKPGGRRSGHPLKHSLSHGYHYVTLYRDGKLCRVKVHRLVLSAWRGPCPKGMEGLHKDDDKDHNDLANLYWGTRIQNRQDMLDNGRNYWSNRTECVNGHPFTEANTYLRRDTRTRQCRQCMLDRNRRSKGVTTFRGLYGGRGDSYVEQP